MYSQFLLVDTSISLTNATTRLLRSLVKIKVFSARVKLTAVPVSKKLAAQ